MLFNKTKIKNFKLLKKYRFWRLFKRFFLFKRRTFFFIKFKWLFNYNRILKHHFSTLFGYKLHNLCFKPFTKYGANNHFFDYWVALESLIYILMVRVKFCYKIKESVLLIKKKLVAVNGSIVLYPKYYLKACELFQKCRSYSLNAIARTKKLKAKVRIKRHLWRWYRWKPARYRLKRFYKERYINLYLLSKVNLVLNYIEINYSSNSAILIRQPVYNELLLNFKRKVYKSFMFKALYSIL